MKNLTREAAYKIIQLANLPRENWVGILSEDRTDKEAALKILTILITWNKFKQEDRENQQIVNEKRHPLYSGVTITNVISKYGITIGQYGNKDVVLLDHRDWEIAE